MYPAISTLSSESSTSNYGKLTVVNHARSTVTSSRSSASLVCSRTPIAPPVSDHMHLCACVCLQKPAAMSRAYGSMARTKLFSLREKLPREALTATNNHRSKIAAIRDHWEQCQFENSEGDMNRADQSVKMSAARPLRRTVVVDKDKLPGGTVYAAQRELVKRHYEAKSKIDGISGIGGGISLWPAMDDMRLSGSDTVRLAVFCVVLVVATLAVFYSFHGNLYHCV